MMSENDIRMRTGRHCRNIDMWSDGNVCQDRDRYMWNLGAWETLLWVLYGSDDNPYIRFSVYSIEEREAERESHGKG